jgi:3-oxoacyl-[acyl-carrier protein] reductase
MRVKDKVAVVTGAGRGIGAVYARALAAQGAHVACADVEQALAKSSTASLTADGYDAIAVTADVSSEEQVATMVEEVIDRFGGIDILVNNAAIYHSMRHDSLTKVPMDYWRRVFAVNVDGVLIVSRAVVPSMTERGGGSIINQTSIAAYTAGNHYNVSKLAVVGITLGLAKELGRHGIRVNAIAPGPIDNEATSATVSEKAMEQLVSSLAIRRAGTPEDLTGALLLLASDEASWLTGQTIRVDGGLILTP